MRLGVFDLCWCASIASVGGASPVFVGLMYEISVLDEPRASPLTPDVIGASESDFGFAGGAGFFDSAAGEGDGEAEKSLPSIVLALRSGGAGDTGEAAGLGLGGFQRSSTVALFGEGIGAATDAPVIPGVSLSGVVVAVVEASRSVF